MIVRQPAPAETSTLLSRTKKSNVRSRPSKVRFAQSISVEPVSLKYFSETQMIYFIYVEIRDLILSQKLYFRCFIINYFKRL